MSLFAWRIVGITGASLFLICFIIMIIFGFTKNRLYKDFRRDELIRRTRGVNSTNFLYFTGIETAKFINKYVIMKTLTDKFLVCHYNKVYKKIAFSVIQYSSTRKVISVLKCVELSTGSSSKIISLKKKCKYVNIVVNKVDGEEINSSVIKPISRTKIKLYCFFKFLLLLGFMVGLRHLICGEYFARAFLNGLVNYSILLASLGVAFVVSILNLIGLLSKNRKARNGGVLEYEFV